MRLVGFLVFGSRLGFPPLQSRRRVKLEWATEEFRASLGFRVYRAL